MSETPPAGYRKLPDGTRCRCIRLWQDGVGGFYCCRSSATLAFADSLSQHCPNCEAQAAEIEKLRDVVAALLQHEASTFFGPDGDKHKRASWRGVIRKAKKASAALGDTK